MADIKHVSTSLFIFDDYLSQRDTGLMALGTNSAKLN